MPYHSASAKSVSVKQMLQTVKMVSGTDHPACNSVKVLLQNSSERLLVSEKMAIKQLGPDKPGIKIVQRTMVGCSIGHFPGYGTTKSFGCLVVLIGIKFSVSHVCFSVL